MAFDTMQWLAWKRDVVALTGFDRDALHIYAAALIQLSAALILRRKLGDWLPWLTVAAIALLNEVADSYSDIWPDRVIQAGNTVHDLVNTMILPTFLLIISRYAPGLAGRS